MAMHSWSSRCITGVRTKAAEPAAATSARTRGIRCRPSAGTTDRGGCSGRLAIHSWSSRCITGVRTKAAAPVAATSTRTRGSCRRTSAGTGRAGSCS
ncbi:hypothetical protein [Paenibacillus tyrfis]|uniref:hypothetical protein n=1 Tax=Paenibacillus tyrfis TaxID=1501230 RepID=UPI00118170AB|nr:hypothetical protein [Paenibacillus tyrfis]